MNSKSILLNNSNNFNWDNKYNEAQGNPDGYGEVRTKMNETLKIQYYYEKGIYKPNLQQQGNGYNKLAFFKNQDSIKYTADSLFLPCKLDNKKILMNIKNTWPDKNTWFNITKNFLKTTIKK